MTDPLKMGWMAWEADSSGGYAHVAEKVFFHMSNDPRFHFVNAYNGTWDALLCVATPALWTLGNGLQPRPDIVFHTMFEATPLPPGWVDVLNCAGLIWTPSQWSYNMFREQGVHTPMFIAGYGVGPEYEYVERDFNTREPMKFVIWGDTLMSRKNVLQTVRAFVDAGLPNAELEIKLHSFAGMNPNTQFTDRKGNAIANITIHTGVWPRMRLVRWLQSAHCGIYLSGGEGLGLMPLEMMKTGLPVVCANNTGMMEYLQPDNHLPVACPKQIKDRTYTLAYGYDAYVWEPDYEQAVEQIRWAYYHRDELHNIGARGANEADRWTWEAQSEIAMQALIQHFRK